MSHKYNALSIVLVWLYGLPKIHKPNFRLRPLLSMIGSVQYHMTKWLVGTLEPELKLYSKHCIYDSFIFTKMIQNMLINPNNSFLWSFDILNLYTNVPLDETFAICTNALYHNHLDPTPLPDMIFLKLMHHHHYHIVLQAQISLTLSLFISIIHCIWQVL